MRKLTKKEDREISNDCWKLQKRLAGNPRIIFDVGAHIGRVVGRYLEMFPNAVVYAFEPEGRNFENMLKRLPKLSGGGKRVKSFRTAVLDYMGTTSFHVANDPTKHSVFKSTQYMPTAFKTINVPETTLDLFCSEHKIEYIDLLKIDVEGGELQVFKGASKLLAEDRIGLIYAEMLFYPYYVGETEQWEICAYLNEYGWGLHSLWTGGVSGHRLLHGNAIFMKREKLAGLSKSER